MCILGGVLLFLAKIVEIDVAEVGKKKKTKFALCGRPIYSPTMFSTSVASLYICWPTGDDVRLSDVVKLSFCLPTVCETSVRLATPYAIDKLRFP